MLDSDNLSWLVRMVSMSTHTSMCFAKHCMLQSVLLEVALALAVRFLGMASDLHAYVLLYLIDQRVYTLEIKHKIYYEY